MKSPNQWPMMTMIGRDFNMLLSITYITRFHSMQFFLIEICLFSHNSLLWLTRRNEFKQQFGNPADWISWKLFCHHPPFLRFYIGIMVVKKNCSMTVLHVSVEEFINSSVLDIWVQFTGFNIIRSWLKVLLPLHQEWVRECKKEVIWERHLCGHTNPTMKICIRNDDLTAESWSANLWRE